MIAYQGIKKTYTADKDLIKELVDFLKSNNFYDPNKEDATILGEKLRAFLDTFICHEKETTLERRETEEEARGYFGKAFVFFYSELLKRMDNANVAVALHGTSAEVAPKIMNEGLKYNSPELLSTAIIQDMPFGNPDFRVTNFETLLNWPHREYKHLVMLGIPYECFYKSGLWKHNEKAQSSYELSYQLPPEFVLGYIDVDNKTIVMNPKYKSGHDFTGLVPDLDIYRNNPDLTPEAIKASSRVSTNEIGKSSRHRYEVTDDVVVTADNYISVLGESAEDMLGTLNSIYFTSGGISEEYYRKVVKELKKMLKIILKSQAFLMSKEEIEKWRLEKVTGLAATPGFDTDFSWDEDVTWDEDEGRRQE